MQNCCVFLAVAGVKLVSNRNPLQKFQRVAFLPGATQISVEKTKTLPSSSMSGNDEDDLSSNKELENWKEKGYEEKTNPLKQIYQYWQEETKGKQSQWNHGALQRFLFKDHIV